MYARPNIKQSTSMNHKHFTTSERESALERLSIGEIYRKLDSTIQHRKRN